MAAPQDASRRAILYALLANFGIALAKSWAAWFTGSGSMLAEAIHSYADTGNQVLLFLGLVQSRRPADQEHPLGYGKLSYFWAFIVAIMLFSIGGLFSIYEGVHKLQSPEPLNQAWVGLVVLGLAILLEGSALFGVLREIRGIRRGRGFRSWLRSTRNAELLVVLGEDVAALTGLLLAMGFLGWAAWSGEPHWDALGSIAIGMVLIVVSIFVAIRIRGLIVGKSADPLLRELIDGMISADPVIEELLNTITLQMGPRIMLAAKIRMRPGLSIEEAVTHINRLEARIKSELPQVGWCFIEPDVSD
ncbi:MAG: cation diffusion facilitator family transporter [Gammaproteobacteria bacterium]|nr:MAG: cation diffusion facilitator family transporter [Gammaproteobacteria bacterium]